MSRLTERERADFRLYIEVIAFIANKNNPGQSYESSKK